MRWTPARIAELRRLSAMGFTNRMIAVTLGITHSAAKNAKAKHVGGKRYAGGKNYLKRALRAAPMWTERALTETWAERKLRKLSG